jgi:hypothetical protein
MLIPAPVKFSLYIQFTKLTPFTVSVSKICYLFLNETFRLENGYIGY